MSVGSLPEVVAQIVSWLSQSEPAVPDWTQDEWALFKQVAFIHGVAPLLHDKLNNGRLPQQLQDWLAWQHRNNHSRITRIQADLQTVLARFAANTIPLIPLKGAILSAVYYPNIAHRPTADIDLLIRPQDQARSLQLLAQLGYEVEKRNWKHAILSQPDNRAVASFDVEHPDNPRRIDLHTTCQEMFSGPMVNITAELWATATEGQLLGEQARILTPEMLHLHLLLHTSSNIWNGVLRLINLLDIVQVEAALPLEPAGPLLPDLIDPRFIYPALLFRHRYLPQPHTYRQIEPYETAVPASFKRWLAAQNIISRSRLRQETTWVYLSRLIALYWGRPKDIIAAIRFLPNLLSPRSE